MANKKSTFKRPLWSIIILLLFSLTDLLMANWINQTGLVSPLNIFAAYAIFGQASGLLVAGVIYLFYRSAQAYDSKGTAIDHSHIWVNARSGKKVGDASVRSVYEKQHGYGSWEKKVKKERGCLTVFATIAAVILTILGFSYLSYGVKLPLLTSVQALLGSNLMYWVSWVLLALSGCFAVFMLYFVFWDLTQYKPLESASPSLIKILPKAIALVLAVLLNIAVLIFTFFPSLRFTPIGKHYTILLSLTYLVSGVLWFFGVILQDYKVKKEYDRKQSPEEKKKSLESAVQILFGKDSKQKERLIAALVLLVNRDSLTIEGKKSVVDVLKIISGEDFGTDYAMWEEWIMKQLKK